MLASSAYGDGGEAGGTGGGGGGAGQRVACPACGVSVGMAGHAQNVPWMFEDSPAVFEDTSV